MNAFQILNKDNQPISLGELDQQAGLFWNQELDPKYYAQPDGNPLGNWFDTIGWGIAHPGNKLYYGLNTWEPIKQQMFEVHTPSMINLSPEAAGVTCCKLFRGLKPYFDLMDHWSSLGYTPKQITN